MLGVEGLSVMLQGIQASLSDIKRTMAEERAERKADMVRLEQIISQISDRLAKAEQRHTKQDGVNDLLRNELADLKTAISKLEKADMEFAAALKMASDEAAARQISLWKALAGMAGAGATGGGGVYALLEILNRGSGG